MDWSRIFDSEMEYDIFRIKNCMTLNILILSFTKMLLLTILYFVDSLFYGQNLHLWIDRVEFNIGVADETLRF